MTPSAIGPAGSFEPAAAQLPARAAARALAADAAPHPEGFAAPCEAEAAGVSPAARTAGATGAASAAGDAVTGRAGSLVPQPPQKRSLSPHFFPQLGQNIANRF
jgi:hypothetical protein